MLTKNIISSTPTLPEEYIRISTELEDLRSQRAEFDKQNNIGNDYRARLGVIIETLNSWQGLLAEFSDEIFNALVEKVEILSTTHFRHNSKGQKYQRIISLEPEVKKGHILFNSANIRYNNQVKYYNKGAKHDDAPDSLYGSVQGV